MNAVRPGQPPEVAPSPRPCHQPHPHATSIFRLAAIGSGRTGSASPAEPITVMRAYVTFTRYRSCPFEQENAPGGTGAVTNLPVVSPFLTGNC